MTPEQQRTVIDVLQTGWVCGLTHPYECMVNMLRHVANIYPYEEVPKNELRIYDAFVAFFNGALSPGEAKLTRETLVDNMNQWYNRSK